MTNLDELFEMMKNNDPRICDQHGQWSTNLPEFGGHGFQGDNGVWSWDKDRVIVGTCADDLEIVEREVEAFRLADKHFTL